MSMLQDLRKDSINLPGMSAGRLRAGRKYWLGSQDTSKLSRLSGEEAVSAKGT